MLSTASVRAIVRLATGTVFRQHTPLRLQRLCYNLLGGYFPLPGTIRIRQLTLAGRSAWQYQSTERPHSHTIIYLHGGGYCIGSLRSHRDLCAHLAEYTGYNVIALDYRLAPEQPFPAALDDTLDAYQELLDTGYSADTISLAGDSAGGGLCLSVLQQCRDKQLPMPAAAYLISPWLDVSNQSSRHSPQTPADYVLKTNWMDMMAEAYLPGQDKCQSQVSPLFGDMHGLPPLLVHIGSEEILLEECYALQKKALDAGVSISLKIWPELWHVFQFTPSLLTPARQALQQAAAFITGDVSENILPG